MKIYVTFVHKPASLIYQEKKEIRLKDVKHKHSYSLLFLLLHNYQLQMSLCLVSVALETFQSASVDIATG